MDTVKLPDNPMTIAQLLTEQVQKAMQKQNDNLEEMLLNFFGSYENAVTYAGDYVLEEDRHFAELSDNILDSSARLRITHTYRLRPKTNAEKNAERAEEILARNVPVGKCIVCKEAIMGVDERVDSIHGMFHMGCVEGHTDA